jgi:hypothetical protein
MPCEADRAPHRRALLQGLALSIANKLGRFQGPPLAPALEGE